MNIDHLGYLAAFLTTLSFLPQAIQTIKTKNTEGISLLMYILFLLGIILWFIYGFIKNEYPIMIGNGITIILASIILYTKLKNN